MEHRRLFAAIELEADARKAVTAEQKRLAANAQLRASGLRLVSAEQLHLTLAFIGEVPSELAAAIEICFREDIPQAPFTLEIGRLGMFPPNGAPRVLWLGVTAGADEAVILQRTVRMRLEALGVALEARTFAPHLTIGRWRHARRSDRPRGLEQSTEGPAVARTSVDAVTLFESRVASAGAVHTALVQSRLRGPRPSLQ